MLKSKKFRERYLSLGSKCVKDDNLWNELVENVLKREGISPVINEHYIVLNKVRQYYLEKERAPCVKEICSETGLTLADFFTLFPDWPHTLFIIDSIVAVVLNIPIWNVEM